MGILASPKSAVKQVKQVKHVKPPPRVHGKTGAEKRLNDSWEVR